MSHSWLQRKRKGELLELAQRANVPDADTLLKDDLVLALEEHLEANESLFAKQPEFSEFYGRSGSPVKRERESPSEALVTTKTRRRTLVKRVDSEEASPARMAVATRTPRPVSRVASRVSEVDLPASPSQLADIADQSFQVAKTKATEIWDKTRIDEAREWLRENVSSVAAIQTWILVIEAVGLQYQTLETGYTAEIKPFGSFGHSREVRIPDLSKLLTSDWWAPATLWSLTNWVLPLVVSYFFNLTLRSNTKHKSSSRQYKADPLTFNIIKALLAYSAYQIPTTADAALAGQPNVYLDRKPGWGPFSEGSVSTVRANVPGGYYGIQIGALVGVLVSLYDAALKK
ncbi:hypothetical protein K458DRAFT_446204 [Lentithecium fluviatile CBS 122367]|uniref:Uncharacterized protein n=1 Tax=Lentithecium fluviatile CBS 122367 TaxID=1168545 RepID=A0A6G1ILA8_9PLEO|nr:hypothetical protein K458DRAFT_446204 [Lentithecium fluviatile CBS 122367]